jgi:hypothetical protein
MRGKLNVTILVRRLRRFTSILGSLHLISKISNFYNSLILVWFSRNLLIRGRLVQFYVFKFNIVFFSRFNSAVSQFCHSRFVICLGSRSGYSNKRFEAERESHCGYEADKGDSESPDLVKETEDNQEVGKRK